jgi:diguanylate cyclase (GGDEF)-like protein/PAS domain S-box-containing protein
VSDVQSPTITEILSLAIALSGVAFSAISVSDGSGTSTESVFGIDRKAVLPCGLKEYLSSIQQQAVVVPNELIDNSLKADYYTEATNRIRFFAGCPIALPDGITFGKLCVFDTVPRTFTDVQLSSLGTLCRQLARHLQSERHSIDTQEEIAKRLTAQEAQRESEAKFHAIIESSNIAYSLIRNGNFEYLNQQFGRTFGYTLSDIPTLNQWWPLAFPDVDYRNAVLERTAKLIAKSKLDGLPFEEFEYRIRCKDGIDRTVIGGARPFGKEYTDYYAVSFYDISERKRVEEEREFLLFEAQDRANKDPLTGLLNHRAFYNKLDEEADRATRDNSRVAIVMLDLDNFKFFNDAYGHATGDEVLRTVANRLTEISRPYDSIGRFGGDEFALLFPGNSDITAESIEERLRAALKGIFYRLDEHKTAIPVTISLGCAIYPDCGMDSHDVLRKADERLRWSKSGGNVELFAQRVRADAGTRVTGFSMLDALVTAVDNKDRYTRRHSEDVMEYTLMIYKQLGLDEDAQQTAAVAALLHDVGKIGVPDAILRKPGMLTDHEFEAVRQHPQMGAVIVGAVAGLEDTLDAVRHHHEQWDGKGYPLGLIGEETPLIARIMAVADAFSAMTTDRPYRKALDRSEALLIIAAGAGRQWDPACVDAFLKAWSNRDSLEMAA